MFFLSKKNNFKNIKKIISEDHFVIENNITYAGKHIIIDLWNCSYDNRISSLKKIIKDAIKLSKAKVLHMHMHRFGKGQGISGVVVLAESHISVHTWPERKYMAFDIFMCGDTFPEKACNYLIEKLKPKSKKVQVVKRGITKIDKKMHRLVK